MNNVVWHYGVKLDSVKSKNAYNGKRDKDYVFVNFKLSNGIILVLTAFKQLIDRVLLFWNFDCIFDICVNIDSNYLVGLVPIK